MNRVKLIILITGIICFSRVHAQGQGNQIDLMEQFNDLNKQMLDEIMMGSNYDSVKCMQMISIAQQLNDDSLLAISYNWLGGYFDSNEGDNISAFEYYYKALPYAFNVNDKRRISSIYFDIATSYFDLKNYKEALRNTIAGGDNLPDEEHPMYSWMLIQYQNNMAQYYTLENIPDSAIFYAHETLKTNEILNSANMDYSSLSYLGSAYSSKGDYIKSDEYFNGAKKLSDQVERNQSNLVFYTLYLPHLFNQGKYDKVKKEALTLINDGYNENNNNLILLGATYLRDAFEMKGDLDSAYYYSKLESEINSTIYNQKNLNKIQALEFGESLRKIEVENQEKLFETRLRTNALLGSSFTLILIALLLFRNNRIQKKSKRKTEIAYERLKNTQSQLIHSEKMASLGEMTAGIAHEIQNPLNFVNNFSDVNKELLQEVMEEIEKGNEKEAKEILSDILENEDKIIHHGHRADSIVKSMLQHSRGSSGEKEITDINALCDEYMRLAYHGLRAKDKSFNADFKLELDENLPNVNVVPQDIGRVMLNLVTNAFQACTEQSESASADRSVSTYKPLVTITTRRVGSPSGAGGSVEISFQDNGSGIPDEIKDKIFEPFFTTKSTGQGTGLGLSMSYDIITKGHGGELKVVSTAGEGSEFIIILPQK